MLNRLKIKINNQLSVYKNKKVLRVIKRIYTSSTNSQKKYKSLLIDGGFYNLNYFYRIQLLRTALKSDQIKEHAFIWDCNINVCKNILNSIGIKNISYFPKSFNKDIFLESEKLAKKINSKEDLINLKLPHNIPGAFLYDTILKRQRSATVNIRCKNLKKYIYKFLYSIKFAEQLINSFKPDIVALSHCISYQCTPLAWIASEIGIPTVILGNEFDILRLWKMSKPKDIYLGFGHPVNKDLKNLSKSKKEKLRYVGAQYIKNRISGNTTDLSGRYAFHGKQKKLNDLGINQKEKKIIAIYSACFFDFPHSYGMNRFLDMLDWLKLTIKKAAENKTVLWLLKPHPMEKWYGGIKLTDILETDLPENIIVLPYDYSGKDVLNIADGLVTFHGTSAIEFAAMGKPVLVADKGWYHDCGFVLFPKSRDHYAKLLTESWYELVNKEESKLNAEIFSGIFFGIPKWQKDLVFPDDSNIEILRKKLPNFVKYKKKIIEREINLIKKWINSDSNDYHIYTIEKYNRFTSLINK